MTNNRSHLPLLLLTFALSACSHPAYDTVSTDTSHSPEKVAKEIAALSAATKPSERPDTTQPAVPAPEPPPPVATTRRGFPIVAGPSVKPIADHTPGIPSTLGALPSEPTPVASTSPSTAPATQPLAATSPAPHPDATAITSSPPPPAVITPTPPSIAADSTLDQAMATLRKHIADHPTLNTALALSLLDIADGKTPDPSAAASLAPTDQKLLTDILTALQGMTAAGASSTTRLSERAAPLVNAAKNWQVDADLTLPKLALASRVDSFGIYTPVPAIFTQGVPHTVLIYCEVANFVSQKGDDNWFTTRLSQQETLLTEDGILAWRPNAEEVEDRSMNQRHDFYLVKKLILPDTLAAGKYTLRMKVVDHNSGKFAIVPLSLEITAK